MLSPLIYIFITLSISLPIVIGIRKFCYGKHNKPKKYVFGNEKCKRQLGDFIVLHNTSCSRNELETIFEDNSNNV
jgi:hypothetical protein